MRRTVKHLATAAVVPLLALGLVACGEEGGGAQVGGKAEASDTATATESPSEEPVDEPAGDEVDTDEFAQRLVDGYEAIDTASFSMEMSGGGFDMSGTGVADYRVTPPSTQLDMTGSAFGGDATIISVDNVLYVQMAGQGKKFMKMDLEQAMGGLGSTDPATMMKTFSEGITAVREIGDESVDGVEATHYEVDVDGTKLKDQAGGVSVPDELTFDVWLDDQDRTVKLEMDLDGTGTMTMQMGEFGVPVEIAAPPASQVQEMPGA